ncbi:MAG: hypothetical protein R2700_08140 [Solirubrobacterales bacterium]
MRDLHLRHTLTTLSRDAAETLTGLVEGGQEIQYEIGEPGEGFAFCQYQPLTARYVRDNAADLRELPTFAEAVETMRRSDIAGPYLEEAGIAPPTDPVERSTLAVTYFLARLWDGCATFEIDDDRFAAAVAEIEDCAEPDEGEVEAIVPLMGFQMSATRLDLNGASIVRADAVDVPAEAARGERPSGAAWEPTFLISARVSLDPDGGLGGAGERVARTFERVVTTLRLYKAGGVGLAPHGWVRVSGDRWRRIATGAGRPRAGGYRLLEGDAEALADLSRTINVHQLGVKRVRWALLRCEAGLDRRGAIDALNDHLLALRFLLEGEGPAGVGLPMRVAALSGASDRSEAKETIERAISLEREIWSGEPAQVPGAPGPSDIAARVEDLLRAILRRGVTGELGNDFRAAADEALLAEGLAFGEGSASELGGDTEWNLEPEPAPEPVVTDPPTLEQIVTADLSDSETATDEPEDFDIPDAERIVVSRAPARSPEKAIREAIAEEETVPFSFVEDDGTVVEAPTEPEPIEAEAEEPAGWLDEVDGGETMNFPARSKHLDDLAKPPLDRDEVKARVKYLFPRTETNWNVGSRSPRRAAG